MFPANKESVSTSRNGGLAEKYAPVERKTASTGSNRLLSE